MLFLGILEELMKKSCLKTNLIDIGAKKIRVVWTKMANVKLNQKGV